MSKNEKVKYNYSKETFEEAKQIFKSTINLFEKLEDKIGLDQIRQIISSSIMAKLPADEVLQIVIDGGYKNLLLYLQEYAKILEKQKENNSQEEKEDEDSSKLLN